MSFSSPLNVFSAEQLYEFYASVSCSLPPYTTEDLARVGDVTHTSGLAFDFGHVASGSVSVLVTKMLSKSLMPGPDHLSPFLITRAVPYLSPLLAELFNRCFNLSYFPLGWKRAFIRPLSKISARRNHQVSRFPSNTRPTSVRI